jgi:hypothetical protein
MINTQCTFGIFNVRKNNINTKKKKRFKNKKYNDDRSLKLFLFSSSDCGV